MERLDFDLPSSGIPAPRRSAVVVGVVASGNLEVMVEASDVADAFRVRVSTSARGFGEVWEAVLRDFATRRSTGGLTFSLNDAGATPAVVSLRLDQALDEYLEPRS
jgi:malonate decarboxylase delta subunit